MATKTTVKSVEPNIVDLANGWLKAYKLDYKLENVYVNLAYFLFDTSFLLLFL